MGNKRAQIITKFPEQMNLNTFTSDVTKCYQYKIIRSWNMKKKKLFCWRSWRTLVYGNDTKCLSYFHVKSKKCEKVFHRNIKSTAMKYEKYGHEMWKVQKYDNKMWKVRPRNVKNTAIKCEKYGHEIWKLQPWMWKVRQWNVAYGRTLNLPLLFQILIYK